MALKPGQQNVYAFSNPTGVNQYSKAGGRRVGEGARNPNYKTSGAGAAMVPKGSLNVRTALRKLGAGEWDRGERKDYAAYLGEKTSKGKSRVKQQMIKAMHGYSPYG